MTLLQQSQSSGIGSQNSPSERLAKLVHTTKSFRKEKEAIIPLASGIMSQYYIDCKMLISFPEARELIGQMMLERLGAEIRSIQAIGGLELGAYPVAIALSDVVYRETGVQIPVFIVRKERKKHGTGKIVEGAIQPDFKVLVVDDVITTGESTRKAIECSCEAGLKVIRSIAIIDRMEGRNRPVPVLVDGSEIEIESLITLKDVLAIHA